MSLGSEFLTTAIHRMKYYKDLGEKTFNQLNSEDMHFQPSSESNSIATIVQHMTGNMLSRWTNFLTEDGEKEWRKRDEEFEIHNYTKEEVVSFWQQGWKCFIDALESLKEDDLLTMISIRNEPLTVIDAIHRQIAHYSYHVGQIVFIGKLLRNDNWKSLSIPKGQSR